MDRTFKARAFTHRLLQLARLYRRGVDREFAAFGVADARAVPILVIDRLGDGVRQGVLAEEIGVRGPSLVRQLDLLCREGLVERRSDPQDGRGKTLHLTEAGRALAARIDRVGDGLRAELLAEVNDQDLATALRVFAQVMQALDARLSRPQAGRAMKPDRPADHRSTTVGSKR